MQLSLSSQNWRYARTEVMSFWLKVRKRNTFIGVTSPVEPQFYASIVWHLQVGLSSFALGQFLYSLLYQLPSKSSLTRATIFKSARELPTKWVAFQFFCTRCISLGSECRCGYRCRLRYFLVDANRMMSRITDYLQSIQKSYGDRCSQEYCL